MRNSQHMKLGGILYVMHRQQIKLYAMPATRTKQLARKLGLVQSKKRKREETGENSIKKRRRNGQLLSYLIVIDFESTCWENRKGFQEIIEFPAVLLDLQTGKIVDEFQQYVLPRDNPKLSDFCKKLTGISQEQVDDGVPIATCLYLFGRWIRKLTEERHVVLMEPGQEYNEEMLLCALATWSDWDLEVCLNYECRRKQIRKPNYFNQWMDIRATYKKFYDQKPSGLSGAMEDLGIVFTGRQHSGIDDARNTARLCYRMIRDGCRLDITKCIQSKANPAVVQPPSSSATSTHANDLSTKPVQLTRECSVSGEIVNASASKPNTYNTNNNTTINFTNTSESTPQMRRNIADVKDSLRNPHINEQTKIEPHNEDTKDNFVDECHWTEDLMKDIAKELDEWDNDSITTEYLQNNHVKDTELRQNCHEVHTSSKSSCSVTTSHPLQECNTLRRGTPSRTDFVSHIAPVTLLSYSSKKTGEKLTVLPSSTKCGPISVMPAMVTLPGQITSNASEVCVVKETPPFSIKTHLDHQDQAKHQVGQQCAGTHSNQQPQKVPSFSLSVNSTPQTSHESSFGRCSIATREAKTPNCAISFRTPSTTEWMKVKRLSNSSTHTPINYSGSTDGSVLLSGGKVTPPLCNCGKRTKRRTVSNQGPNEGKNFYACPNGKASDKSRGCGFFKWEIMLASPCSPKSMVVSHLCASSNSTLEPEYHESKR